MNVFLNDGHAEMEEKATEQIIYMSINLDITFFLNIERILHFIKSSEIDLLKKKWLFLMLNRAQLKVEIEAFIMAAQDQSGTTS